jgi:hypothetical protein
MSYAGPFGGILTVVGMSGQMKMEEVKRRYNATHEKLTIRTLRFFPWD